MGSDLYAGYRKRAPMRLFDQTKQVETPMPGLRPQAARNPTSYLHLLATMTQKPSQIQKSIEPQRRDAKWIPGSHLTVRPGMTVAGFPSPTKNALSQCEPNRRP